MNYRQLYRKGSEILLQGEVPDAELDARLLLEFVCRITRNDLLVHGDRECELALENRYLEMIEKRKKRIPLQQLTGQQDFMGLTFKVDENVLVPRPDTEILVEEVMKDLHGGMRILDLCTGSGCILISLLHYSNECSGVGVDISDKALKVAAENAQMLVPEEDYLFLQSDLYEKVEGKFDLLVSNPPYIPSKVVDTLMPEVREHEPRIALDGSEDGLLFYRKIMEGCRDHLNPGAAIFFEIGFDQADQVSKLLEESGCLEIRVVQDYAGLDRVVTGIWTGGR